jgi:outer membrane receptor protein involved in Fe transport
MPNQFGTPYPAYQNEGTSQPKFDARVDYDFPDGHQKVTVAGGLAGTSGIMHTGIGPFRIEQGTVLGYSKVDYTRGPLKLKFFVNLLDGKAPALLSRDVRNEPIQFVFKNQTYDFEVGNVQALGTRHVFSYGGNIRHNAFDLSVASRANSRNEGGVYLQDEIFLTEHLRWVLGGRLDRFDVLDHFVFSPRTTFMIKPGQGAHLPALVQPRVSRAVAGEQLPRCDDTQRAGPRPHNTRARRRCGSRSRWPRWATTTWKRRR